MSSVYVKGRRRGINVVPYRAYHCRCHRLRQLIGSCMEGAQSAGAFYWTNEPTPATTSIVLRIFCYIALAPLSVMAATSILSELGNI